MCSTKNMGLCMRCVVQCAYGQEVSHNMNK